MLITSPFLQPTFKLGSMQHDCACLHWKELRRWREMEIAFEFEWVPGSKIPQEVMRRAAPTLSFIFSHIYALLYSITSALSGNLGFRHSL
jgi:hypothetical protein